MALKRQFLGELLLASGLLTKVQLEECLSIQEQTGARLGDVALEKGLLTHEQLMDILENQFNVPYADLARLPISHELASIIPVAIARRNNLVPVKTEENILYVAIEDPRNIPALEEVRFASHMEVQPMLAAGAGIQSAINRLYGSEAAEQALKDIRSQGILEEITSIKDAEEDINSAPIVRLCNAILEQAVNEEASDIHIEPLQNSVRTRIRVDGMLTEHLTLPKSALNAIVARLKILGKMNIAEKRLPQDGRFDAHILGNDIDVRLSTMPTVHGEKIVLRLLNRNNFLIPKEKLGFTEANLRKFEELLRNPHGIILVTGPTGSGKSTTLYTMLSEINNIRDNIVTVEDPVEYMLTGLNQMQVNVKAGLDFSTGLRSILRQDPDVIMVGEIRDTDTVQIAIRAAITGHLVLSTIHTNDAVSTIYRLIDMGVPSYLVSAALAGIVSQRLVKTICPLCRQHYFPEIGELEIARLETGRIPRAFYRGTGCGACANTGYKGRIAVIEILMMDSTIREMIHNGDPLDNIRQYAAANGMSSIRNECISLIEDGITTLSELVKL